MAAFICWQREEVTWPQDLLVFVEGEEGMRLCRDFLNEYGERHGRKVGFRGFDTGKMFLVEMVDEPLFEELKEQSYVRMIGKNHRIPPPRDPTKGGFF